jgi:Mg2+ and Co2+ transporter CorA
MLFHLGYVSTQTRAMRDDDLLGLLETARRSNESKGITGLLLHRVDSFFQILEGEEDAVREVYAQIVTDKRHDRVKVLFEGPIAAREFSDWRMGFLELDGVDVRSLPGFSDFLFEDSEPRRFLEELTEAKRLMLLFRAMA